MLLSPNRHLYFFLSYFLISLFSPYVVIYALNTKNMCLRRENILHEQFKTGEFHFFRRPRTIISALPVSCVCSVVGCEAHRHLASPSHYFRLMLFPWALFPAWIPSCPSSESLGAEVVVTNDHEH